MTATIQTATESQRKDTTSPRPQAAEVGFEAALLGSVGKSLGAATTHDSAGVGRQSASAAPNKRRDDEKEVVKRAKAMSDPSAIAAGELATQGAPKATTQAAEAQQVTAAPKAEQPRSRSTNDGSNQPSTNKPDAPAATSEASGSHSGRRAASSDADAKSNSGESGTKQSTPRAGIQPASKATITQTKPLDAGQALARLAQAINRAADHPAATPNANRSVLRVETARPAQRTAAIKSAAPPSDPNRAQQSQDDFAAQLHRGFSAVLRQNGGSLTLRMQPEQLGDLTIRMDLQPGQVTADFEVGSDQARQLLTDHMTSLRSALEARGLSVDKLTVHVSDRPTPEALANRAEHGNNGGAGTHDGGASSGRGGQSGVEHPQITLARSASETVPGEGADVHMGGAQTVRLVLDAVA